MQNQLQLETSWKTNKNIKTKAKQEHDSIIKRLFGNE